MTDILCDQMVEIIVMKKHESSDEVVKQFCCHLPVFLNFYLLVSSFSLKMFTILIILF